MTLAVIPNYRITIGPTGFQPEINARPMLTQFLIRKCILHIPLSIFSSSGILQKEMWQGKTVYNQSQKDILQKQSEHNLYPDCATRKQLAKETGIPEYNSQVSIKFPFHYLSESR